MSDRQSADPPNGPQEEKGHERLTLEEFKRLAEEAKRRGEPLGPLVKRLVLSTIDEVMEKHGS